MLKPSFRSASGRLSLSGPLAVLCVAGSTQLSGCAADFSTVSEGGGAEGSGAARNIKSEGSGGGNTGGGENLGSGGGQGTGATAGGSGSGGGSDVVACGGCDDENPCTIDSCNEDGSCNHVPRTTGFDCGVGVCDDAGACVRCLDTKTGTGQDLGCTAGSPVCSVLSGEPACVGCTAHADCNDGNACTVDECDIVDKTCSNEPATLGTSCGGGRFCAEGLCVECTSDELANCDAGPTCTSPTCENSSCKYIDESETVALLTQGGFSNESEWTALRYGSAVEPDLVMSESQVNSDYLGTGAAALSGGQNAVAALGGTSVNNDSYVVELNQYFSLPAETIDVRLRARFQARTIGGSNPDPQNDYFDFSVWDVVADEWLEPEFYVWDSVVINDWIWIDRTLSPMELASYPREQNLEFSIHAEVAASNMAPNGSDSLFLVDDLSLTARVCTQD